MLWKKNRTKQANCSVSGPYQVRGAESWLASCCPLQLCCCCNCCCLLGALLLSPSYTRRQTDTGCTASWASWRSYWMCPCSSWWTAHATFCFCSPEWQCWWDGKAYSYLYIKDLDHWSQWDCRLKIPVIFFSWNMQHFEFSQNFQGWAIHVFALSISHNFLFLNLIAWN